MVFHLLEMLNRLRETIARQDTFRFFSSSLLIIYDGRVVLEKCTMDKQESRCPQWPEELLLSSHDPPESNTVTNLTNSPRELSVGIPMTSQTKATHQQVDIAVPGKQATRENHDRSCQNVTEEEKEGRTTRPVRGENGKNAIPPNELQNATAPNELNHRNCLLKRFADARRIVDVRMIDFAHTTHRGCPDDLVKYTGPDDGYLLGLRTLISAFSDVASNSHY